MPNTQVHKQEPQPCVMYCSECKHDYYDPNYRYCSECGAKLVSDGLPLKSKFKQGSLVKYTYDTPRGKVDMVCRVDQVSCMKCGDNDYVFTYHMTCVEGDWGGITVGTSDEDLLSEYVHEGTRILNTSVLSKKTVQDTAK